MVYRTLCRIRYKNIKSEEGEKEKTTRKMKRIAVNDQRNDSFSEDIMSTLVVLLQFLLRFFFIFFIQLASHSLALFHLFNFFLFCHFALSLSPLLLLLLLSFLLTFIFNFSFILYEIILIYKTQCLRLESVTQPYKT